MIVWNSPGAEERSIQRRCDEAATKLAQARRCCMLHSFSFAAGVMAIVVSGILTVFIAPVWIFVAVAVAMWTFIAGGAALGTADLVDARKRGVEQMQREQNAYLLRALTEEDRVWLREHGWNGR